MTHADEVTALLLAAAGSGYIGEAVSQLEHALQAAAAAERSGAPEAEVLAALLHDVGHLCAEAGAASMAGLGVVDHEAIGAAWLRARGFSESVCALVAGHVQAKRYLVATNARYAAALSPASAGTLAFQGGPMSPAEVARFDEDPLRAAMLRVRRWDEAAKDPAAQVPGLEHYGPMIERHLQAKESDR